MIIDIPERILRAAELRRSSPTRLAISRKTMLQKFEKIPVNTTILILFPCLLPCFLHFLVVFPVSIGTITPADHHLLQYTVVPSHSFRRWLGCMPIPTQIISHLAYFGGQPSFLGIFYCVSVPDQPATLCIMSLDPCSWLSKPLEI